MKTEVLHCGDIMLVYYCMKKIGRLAGAGAVANGLMQGKKWGREVLPAAASTAPRLKLFNMLTLEIEYCNWKERKENFVSILLLRERDFSI